MNTNTFSNQFGVIIAYLLPGFIALAGIAPYSPLIASWLHPATYTEASLGPPVYALLAAITIGKILSVFRWILVDHVLHWTGITPPNWNDSRLDKKLGAFQYIVENHYRYYQFVANTLVAVIAAYLINRWSGTTTHLNALTDVGVVVLCAALFAAARDALAKYYARTSRLLGRE